MTMRGALAGLTILALAAASAGLPSSSRAESVGTAAAVRPSSTGTPPGGATRTLDVGMGIVSKERIKTTGSGSLQVMFLDKTTLTIGPSSDLLIDEFVYSANQDSGRFTARLTKGALRFVGGQISHTTGATVTTPSATIGIRGGAAFITYDSDCQQTKNTNCTKVVCTGGTCSVKSLIDSRSLQLKIGQAVEIGAIGAAQFNVTSVTLNDVARGGDGAITTGSGNESQAEASFTGQSTIDQTVAEQQPEPIPPAPPGP